MTDDHPAMRMVMPIGRSSWAIIAGYAGLLSFFIVPAPAAIVLGLIAIIHVRRTGTRGMGRSMFAVLAGIAGTIVLVLSLLRM